LKPGGVVPILKQIHRGPVNGRGLGEQEHGVEPRSVGTAKRDPMRAGEPTVDEFDSQMRVLREYFHPLPLLDAVERLHAGALPDGAVCVTFDDGYADNEIYAMPVLKKYRIPATVFVSTGFLNGGRMWNDSVIEVLRSYKDEVLDLRELDLDCYTLRSTEQRLDAVDSILRQIKHFDPQKRIALADEIQKRGPKLPDDLMLTDAQIQSLAHNGVTIGAHTVNHPILSSISGETARSEIQESKQYLETLLQEPIDVFAYPNGRPELDYTNEHRNLVSELGFKVAVSTHWGVSTTQSDRYQLPRFTPWDRHPLKFAIRLLANYRKIDPLISARS
jgi:peptidoglycan/xylan/chitin deacetylase (PgdA/CDA1 family)